MFCTNCGNKIPDNANFCTSCGAKAGNEAPVEEKVEAPVEEIVEAPAEEVAEAPAEEVAEAPVEAVAEEPAEEAAEQADKAEAQAEAAKAQAEIAKAQAEAAKAQAEAAKAQAEATSQQINAQNSNQARRPALQLPTERGLLKMIFLGLITFGIYNFVVLVRISEEINITASRYDGQRTMHYTFVPILGTLTLGIYTIVWMHCLCNRLGQEVRRRNYDYKFSASTMWLWGVLGSLIIIGPFIYIYKFMKTSNLINKSYNYYG